MWTERLGGRRSVHMRQAEGYFATAERRLVGMRLRGYLSHLREEPALLAKTGSATRRARKEPGRLATTGSAATADFSVGRDSAARGDARGALLPLIT